MSSDVWTCSSCGRVVPGRVHQCRCGAEAPQAPADQIGTNDTGSDSPKLWLIAVLVLALAGALYVRQGTTTEPSVERDLRPSTRLTRKPAADAPGPAAELHDEPVPAPAAAAPAPTRMVPLDSSLVAESPTSSSAAAPARLAEGSARPLEDIVSRASAAVVGIETTSGRGTGFFVTSELLVTNAHVVQGHSYVTVRLAGGRTSQGRVERSSTDVDLAVVRTSVRADEIQILQLGSSRGVQPRPGSPGDWLAARPSEHGHARDRQRRPKRRRRRADSNRCRDQPRQQRRPADRPRWAGHRRDHTQAGARR